MAAEAILRPYRPQRGLWLGWRVLLVAFMVLVAAFYGLMAAVLPLRLITIPLIPILIMAGLCLWLLPDVGGVYERLYAKCLLIVLTLQILWPYYVALNLPGLPLISPTRVVIAVMASAFLFNLATSAEMRTRAATALAPEPGVRKLYGFWVVLMVATVPLSADPITSGTKVINNQIYWTMFLILAAISTQRPGWALKACRVLVAATIPVALVSLYEYTQSRVFWIEYIPDFLMAREELTDRLLASSARSTTRDIYRIRGTFTVPLYFAEYLSIVLPLALHLAGSATGTRRRFLLWAGVMAIMSALVLTNSRSGMIGILLTILLYVLLDALRRRTDRPHSLLSTATLLAYPAGAGVLAALVLLWRRAYVAVIGGGQHKPSDDARRVQWERTFEHLQSNPFGHGAARSGEVVGYTNPAGELTIDSYYMQLLIDYGAIALPLFLVLFSIPIIRAFQAALSPDRDEETSLLLPIGVAIFNFMFLKSVLQGEWNMPLVMVLFGIGVTLHGRLRGVSAPAPRRELVRMQPGLGATPA